MVLVTCCAAKGSDVHPAHVSCSQLCYQYSTACQAVWLAFTALPRAADTIRWTAQQQEFQHLQSVAESRPQDVLSQLQSVTWGIRDHAKFSSVRLCLTLEAASSQPTETKGTLHVKVSPCQLLRMQLSCKCTFLHCNNKLLLP